MGASLLRLRSDEQLVALFRAGHEEAFRAIHDRYRQRLFAYTRQMLDGRQDAEDALQDVFVRAYSGLRTSDRKLALRAWLYRIAHNRCVDELRRPSCAPTDVTELRDSFLHPRAAAGDPLAEAEQRESLRRLIVDVRRLPEQQRSALLMRELSGMSYSDLADALGVTVPAVKSLLVRARVGLVRAIEARDTSCSEIREEIALAHDRGVRPNSMARRHMRDCRDCSRFREAVRGNSRELAALAPALGPLAWLVHLIGGGGTAAASSASSGAAAAGGTGGLAASGGVLAVGAGHVATMLAAAVVTAGSAVEIQHTLTAPGKTRSRVVRQVIASGGVSATREIGVGSAVSHTPTAGVAAAAQEGTSSRSGSVSHHSHGGGASGPVTASGPNSPAGNSFAGATNAMESNNGVTAASGSPGTTTAGGSATSGTGVGVAQSTATPTSGNPAMPGEAVGGTPGSGGATGSPSAPGSAPSSPSGPGGGAGTTP